MDKYNELRRGVLETLERCVTRYNHYSKNYAETGDVTEFEKELTMIPVISDLAFDLEVDIGYRKTTDKGIEYNRMEIKKARTNNAE